MKSKTETKETKQVIEQPATKKVYFGLIRTIRISSWDQMPRYSVEVAKAPSSSSGLRPSLDETRGLSFQVEVANAPSSNGAIKKPVSKAR